MKILNVWKVRQRRHRKRPARNTGLSKTYDSFALQHRIKPREISLKGWHFIKKNNSSKN